MCSQQDRVPIQPTKVFVTVSRHSADASPNTVLSMCIALILLRLVRILAIRVDDDLRDIERVMTILGEPQDPKTTMILFLDAQF